MSEIGALNTSELLHLYGGILDELRNRGVVRSRNAPAGDLAETLAMLVYQGQLAPPSEKSWDVRAGDGRLIQVKCRVLVPGKVGAFSPFRSTDFNVCVFVVLDPTYRVVSAVELPAEQVRANARDVAWVNGIRVTSAQNLAGRPGAVDLTAQFNSALNVVDQARADTPITQSE